MVELAAVFYKSSPVPVSTLVLCRDPHPTAHNLWALLICAAWPLPAFPARPLSTFCACCALLRAADLLPVVLLVDAGDRGSMGLLLNRRTGMLMGDLGDDFKTFMIQVGGVVHTGGARRSFFHFRLVVSFGFSFSPFFCVCFCVGSRWPVVEGSLSRCSCALRQQLNGLETRIRVWRADGVNKASGQFLFFLFHNG